MFEERFEPGDMVYARGDLLSDGHVPGTHDGEVLVPRGARGMVVQVGHVETSPEVRVYLVRFEDDKRELGDALGCLADELTQQTPFIDTTPAP